MLRTSLPLVLVDRGFQLLPSHFEVREKNVLSRHCKSFLATYRSVVDSPPTVPGSSVGRSSLTNYGPKRVQQLRMRSHNRNTLGINSPR